MAAPATLAAPQKDAGLKLTANVLSIHNLGMALLLSPVHSYKKNNLYMEEHMILKGLSCANAAMDHRVTLRFTKRAET